MLYAVIAMSVASCSPMTYGAKGDGVTDDRIALQTAIYACDEIRIPRGHYLVSRAAWQSFNLHVPTNRRIIGAGVEETILIQAPGQTANVRLLHVDGADVSISALTLVGDQTSGPDEHRAGIFATGATRLAIHHVAARNFTGDGFYIHIGTNDIVVDHVEAYDNDRSGLAFGGGTVGALIINSKFYANGVQQIDSEPKGSMTVDGVSLSNNVIDGSPSNDYAITVSGSSSESRSSGWTIVENEISGGIFVVWADGIIIAHNTMINRTTKPCVTIWRRSVGVSVSKNSCLQMQDKVDSLAAIAAFGTGPADMPEGVSISDNNVEVIRRVRSFGVTAQGVRSVAIVGNKLIGPGGGAFGYAGVYVRTTILSASCRSVVIAGNEISSWADVDVRLAGNTADGSRAKIDLLVLGQPGSRIKFDSDVEITANFERN